MSGISTIVQPAISDFKKEIEDKVEQNCKVYCKYILDAAITWRLHTEGAHNFTGNLINSIVVCLYKKNEPLVAYYSHSKVKRSIFHKMTQRKQVYDFYKDWDGVESMFDADEKTDEGYGENDAKKFFQQYRPNSNSLFDIVVAYPVEYADFVENKRQTTGYLMTKNVAENVGLTFLKM